MSLLYNTYLLTDFKKTRLSRGYRVVIRRFSIPCSMTVLQRDETNFFQRVSKKYTTHKT